MNKRDKKMQKIGEKNKYYLGIMECGVLIGQIIDLTRGYQITNNTHDSLSHE